MRPHHLFRRLRRRTAVLLVAALVAVVGAGGWLATRSDGSPAATPITYTVARSDVQQTVSATGTLAAAHEADLDFEVAGKVTSVAVKPGRHVHKGQVLARVDDTTLRAALDAARAQLSAAQTQYTSDSGASSTQLASDSAQIASARATLDQAEANLSAAQLRSSITGMVASVDVAVGDQVAGGSAGSNGSTSNAAASTTTSQFVVVSPRDFVVNADVSADDVTAVKKGMQAQLTPTGATQPIFGTVSSVGMVADTSSSGVATFPVTIGVTGAQKNLYAGTSVTVSVIVKQLSNVLAVPALALSSSGGATYVQKVVNGRPVKTAVTVGATYGAQTQITKGLSSGDKIQLGTGSFTRVSGNSSNRGRSTFGGGGGLPGGFSGSFPGGNGPQVQIDGGR